MIEDLQCEKCGIKLGTLSRSFMTFDANTGHLCQYCADKRKERR